MSVGSTEQNEVDMRMVNVQSWNSTQGNVRKVYPHRIDIILQETVGFIVEPLFGNRIRPGIGSPGQLSVEHFVQVDVPRCAVVIKL